MGGKIYKDKIGLGVIGLGHRGRDLMKLLLGMEDVAVVAVSDKYEDRRELAVQEVQAAGRAVPQAYERYQDLLARADVDAVVIASSWTSHVEIAIAALKAGKYAASEVGGASSLEECWQLVRTVEETGMQAMLLENCCYGRDEMAVLRMVKEGLFGELVHCQGAYEHDLREEISSGFEKRHYRLNNYLHRNGDVYPTHGLGPAAKYLNVNRGNRFVALSSMASKARGLNLWAAEHLGADHPSAKANFAVGDIVTTMIRCAQGETIVLTHDTSLPRPYSRGQRVQGTKGIWMEDGDRVHLEGTSPGHEWEPFVGFRERYEHPVWQGYLKDGVRGGHGGMDYLVLRAFAESVAERKAPPIDVYDMAAWMAVTALSEQSVQLGGTAVAFPDFTNGKWIDRGADSSGYYAL